jgi:hypothetical protein
MGVLKWAKIYVISCTGSESDLEVENQVSTKSFEKAVMKLFD